ncbi:MAG: hypothetical protein OXG49_05985 [Chloroflexi bacterium]|nr:hypothetical protein [Chloroflexota bacterium]
MTDQLEAPNDESEQTVTPSSLSLPADLLAAIPEEQREEFTQKFGEYLVSFSREERYAGPLLPSREAERWEKLVPGSAVRNFDLYEMMQLKRMETQDRVLTLTEDTSQHDMQVEMKQHDDGVNLTRTELTNKTDEVKRGQNYAFAISLLIILGGFTMIHLGHDIGGIASLLVGAASVAGIFVTQMRSREAFPAQKDRDEQSN